METNLRYQKRQIKNAPTFRKQYPDCEKPATCKTRWMVSNALYYFRPDFSFNSSRSPDLPPPGAAPPPASACE